MHSFWYGIPSHVHYCSNSRIDFAFCMISWGHQNKAKAKENEEKQKLKQKSEPTSYNSSGNTKREYKSPGLGSRWRVANVRERTVEERRHPRAQNSEKLHLVFRRIFSHSRELSADFHWQKSQEVTSILKDAKVRGHHCSKKEAKGALLPLPQGSLFGWRQVRQ